jgi:hypothetical protein
MTQKSLPNQYRHFKTQTAMNTEDFKYHENKLNSILEELQLEQNATAEKLQHAASRIARKSAEAAACLVGMFNAIGQNNPLRYTNNGMRAAETDKTISFAEYARRFSSLPKPSRIASEMAESLREQISKRSDDVKDAFAYATDAAFGKYKPVPFDAYQQRPASYFSNAQGWLIREPELMKEIPQPNSSQRYTQNILNCQVRKLSLGDVVAQTEKFAKYAYPNESYAEYAEREKPLTFKEFVLEFTSEPAPSEYAAKLRKRAEAERGPSETITQTMNRLEREEQATKESIFDWEGDNYALLNKLGIVKAHFFGPTDNRCCVYTLIGNDSPSCWYIASARMRGHVFAFGFLGNVKCGRWNFTNDVRPHLANLASLLLEATAYVKQFKK